MNISHNSPMLLRGNKFGEIHNFNLVEACQSKIFDSNLLKINHKKQGLQE